MKQAFFTLAIICLTLTAFSQTNNVGINTTSPQATLHVIRDSLVGGPPASNIISILESRLPSYLQFSQLSNVESGILSGTNLTTVRSSMIFGIDSSLLFQTGGSNTRIKISKTGSLGIGTTSPASSALVDMTSTTKGLVIPRMTTAQRNAIVSPVAGLLVYDLDAKTIYMHDGTTWIPFALSAASVPKYVSVGLPTAMILSNAQFGFSVAIFGDRAIVGAPKNRLTGGTTEMGSVTFYTVDASGLVEGNTIGHTTPAADDHLGYCVDINNNYAIVGVPDDDSGAFTDNGGAKIYFFDGSNWNLQADLAGNASNSHFGCAVALYNGNTAGIISSGEDHVRIFTRSGTTWTQTSLISQSIPSTGSQVTFSENRIAILGDSPKIYKYTGSSWISDGLINTTGLYESFTIQGNEAFGGTYGKVDYHKFNGASWVFQSSILPDGTTGEFDDFGHSIAVDGDNLLVGAPYYDEVPFGNSWGIVYLYKRNGNNWVLTEKIKQIGGTSNVENFGISVDISGGRYVIGSLEGQAPDHGGGVSFGKIY